MMNREISKEEPCVDDYVDWRGRPCKPGKHGGMHAALAILGNFPQELACMNDESFFDRIF